MKKIVKTKDGRFKAVEMSTEEYENLKKKIISSFTEKIQSLLDRKAREYGYDSILSACTYASYKNPYQTEGRRFLVWRANVWKYLFDLIDNAEDINMLNEKEILENLPKFEDTKLT